MSTMVTVRELGQRDIFALPNGSLYELDRQSTADEPAQAHLWCAHPTNPDTVEPARVALAAEQQVSLLSPAETRVHVGHTGYSRTVFAQEMDRHHQERMKAVTAAHAEAAARHARVERPWWQKLFR